MKHITLPVKFIDDLASARSVSEILNIVASWLPEIMDCDRGSIALVTKDKQGLSVYAMQGNQAINMGVVMPIENTLIGRAFQAPRAINFKDMRGMSELDAVKLVEAGLQTCLDAPLRSGTQCFGTLNIAHHEAFHFDEHAEASLQSLAAWIASHIRIYEQSETDALTQLLNRRAFNSISASLWERFERDESSFVFCLLDLDHFKRVNDSFGHVAGDKTLIRIADTLRSITRKSDHIARLGGEEFGVVLVDMPIHAASSWAERLRHNIEQLHIDLDTRTLRVTSSIGIAEPSHNDLSFDAVYRRADAALYKSKGTGRNLVSIGRSG